MPIFDDADPGGLLVYFVLRGVWNGREAAVTWINGTLSGPEDLIRVLRALTGHGGAGEFVLPANVASRAISRALDRVTGLEYQEGPRSAPRGFHPAGTQRPTAEIPGGHVRALGA